MSYCDCGFIALLFLVVRVVLWVWCSCVSEYPLGWFGLGFLLILLGHELLLFCFCVRSWVFWDFKDNMLLIGARVFAAITYVTFVLRAVFCFLCVT